MLYPPRITSAFAAGFLTLLCAAPRTAADVETHKALIGKPAPEIAADFCTNGKAIKLADLKKKVVLVVFWAPWSGPSQAVLDDLRKWHETFARQGLEIVAIGAYTFELLPKKGFKFDTTTGKFDKHEAPTRETEQQMVRDFAEFHRLPFRAMLVPGEECEKMRKVYGVRSVPQFVVIDPKGVVRLIRVGSDPARVADVEAEIRRQIEKLTM